MKLNDNGYKILTKLVGVTWQSVDSIYRAVHGKPPPSAMALDSMQGYMSRMANAGYLSRKLVKGTGGLFGLTRKGLDFLQEKNDE